jgi:tetratricopeptide (TPR) repeat protein
MQVFSVKDVERVLKMPRSAIHSLVRSGYVAPNRGRRRQYEFSFQDLVALRTARALMLARVSPRRITQAMRQLRQEVPDAPRAGSLRICASGTEVVVRDESGPWRTPAGQYLLEFEVSVKEGAVRVLDRPAEGSGGAGAAGLEASAGAGTGARHGAGEHEALNGDVHFDRALALETSDAEAAIRAYQQCLKADPSHTAARVNCGRLLHAAERAAEAEAIYRPASGVLDEDPDLLFNLALLLEDTGREAEAAELYQRAVAIDPDFADAHFNLARLYQELRMPRAAIRHWNRYRRLTLERES